VIAEANPSLYGFLDALPAVHCGKPRGTQVLQSVWCAAWGEMREVRLRECARCKFYRDCGARLTPRLSDVPSTIAGIPVADQALIAAESSSPPLEGERKTVTALFADIKGSTELQQHLDLEEARAIIDPALKIMIDAARHYGTCKALEMGSSHYSGFP
jgi:hypothetical protein